MTPPTQESWIEELHEIMKEIDEPRVENLIWKKEQKVKDLMTLTLARKEKEMLQRVEEEARKLKKFPVPPYDKPKKIGKSLVIVRGDPLYSKAHKIYNQALKDLSIKLAAMREGKV